MSQKKVDAYKQRKFNREKIMKKEKMMLRLEKAIAVVVCLIAVVWIGASVYGKVTESQETTKVDTVMDTAALDDYLSSIVEEAE